MALAACCGGRVCADDRIAAGVLGPAAYGSVLLAQENVKSIVAAALAQPDAQIVIHHRAGQEPQVQAEELRSWLGALAIDTRRIALRNDLGAGASIKMEIMP